MKYINYSQLPVLDAANIENNRAYLNLEAARIKALSYAELILAKKIITVGDYAEYQLAKAIFSTCTSVAYRNLAQSNLNENARRYWCCFTKEKLLTKVSNLEHHSLGGWIGSLGFYSLYLINTKQNNEKNNYLKSLLELLDLFWADLNLSRELSISDRLDRVLSNLDLAYLNRIEVAFKLYLITERPKDLELGSITSKSLDNLAFKLILGEVPDRLISALANFQIQCNRDRDFARKYGMTVEPYSKVFEAVQYTLSITKGGSFPLIIQAVYIENLINIYLALKPYQFLSMNEFARNSSVEFKQLYYDLVNYLVSALDALDFLSTYNTLDYLKADREYLDREARAWLSATEQSSLNSSSRWSNILFKYLNLENTVSFKDFSLRSSTFNILANSGVELEVVSYYARGYVNFKVKIKELTSMYFELRSSQGSSINYDRRYLATTKEIKLPVEAGQKGQVYLIYGEKQSNLVEFEGI